MHARGEVKVGDVQRSRSIIGGEFLAEVLGETTVGGRAAILPRITGQAWIYGTETLRVDPEDRFARGFALSDVWGPYID
jgi:proline racemase